MQSSILVPIVKKPKSHIASLCVISQHTLLTPKTKPFKREIYKTKHLQDFINSSLLAEGAKHW